MPARAVAVAPMAVVWVGWTKLRSWASHQAISLALLLHRSEWLFPILLESVGIAYRGATVVVTRECGQSARVVMSRHRK